MLSPNERMTQHSEYFSDKIKESHMGRHLDDKHEREKETEDFSIKLSEAPIHKSRMPNPLSMDIQGFQERKPYKLKICVKSLPALSQIVKMN